jgi:acetylornithine deacetylase/succinyl-diaminopimelate desuccinylase-like protein
VSNRANDQFAPAPRKTDRFSQCQPGQQPRSHRLCADVLAGLGIASTLVHNEDGRKANLWATIGPEGKPGIVLSGHTDVVPVEGQSWSSDPFRLDRRDGNLYGRGTADMKGFIACCLAAGEKAAAQGSIRRSISPSPMTRKSAAWGSGGCSTSSRMRR